MGKKITVFVVLYLFLTIAVFVMMRYFDYAVLKKLSILGILVFSIIISAYLIFDKNRKQTLTISVPFLVLFLLTNYLFGRFNYIVFRDTFISTNYKSFNWEQGKPVNELNTALNELEDIDRLYSVVVIKNGKLIAKRYYHGASENNAFNLNSVTKTVTSLLIGIAIEEKIIDSLTQPIINFFPEFREKLNDPRKLKISVQDLLSMKAGFAYDCFDCTEFFFTKMPLVSEPGQTFLYSNGSYNLLSEIILKQSKKSAMEYASKKLFKPLNIQTEKWHKLSNGNNSGAFGLYLTTTDMARIGLLLLKDGKIDSNLIVSENWIKRMQFNYTTNYKRKNENSSNFKVKGYGLGCWITETNGYKTFTARGHGGQMIHIIPDKNIVIAITQKDLFIKPNQQIDKPELLFNILSIMANDTNNNN